MGRKNFRQKQILFRALIKKRRILPHLEGNDKILDIGTGNGGLVHLLRKDHGLDIQPVDITNKSAFQSVEPIIYDGSKLPFPDNKFETVMLITVLHHTSNPYRLLEEATRVSSDKVLVMEDIYSNSLQKYLTYFMDSLVNWEFLNHPHTNKTDEEWKKLFEKLSLEIKNIAYYRFAVLFNQVLYVLKKKKGRSV